ncbi:MAG TPA: hypothetical protein VLH79_12960, partial [Chthonomonadales bacterium]|nr:hypothetical protein [Chthonomonadales bacterium]
MRPDGRASRAARPVSTAVIRVAAGCRRQEPNSVAAGRPPDVIFVDGPQVAEWAEQSAIKPLDQMLAHSGVQRADCFPRC